MNKSVPVMGVCQYCGCSDASPCRLPDGETCVWVDRLRICCSKWSCQQARASAQKRDRRRQRKEVQELRSRFYKGVRERRGAKRAAEARSRKRKQRGRAV